MHIPYELLRHCNGQLNKPHNHASLDKGLQKRPLQSESGYIYTSVAATTTSILSSCVNDGIPNNKRRCHRPTIQNGKPITRERLVGKLWETLCCIGIHKTHIYTPEFSYWYMVLSPLLSFQMLPFSSPISNIGDRLEGQSVAAFDGITGGINSAKLVMIRSRLRLSHVQGSHIMHCQ